jgi:hypothetical protein
MYNLNMQIPFAKSASLRSSLFAGVSTFVLAWLLLTGCGKKSQDNPKPHSVTISWAASTSTVVGYFIYRAPSPGGPYMKLNPTPVHATQYNDATVEAGRSYAYHVTAAGSNGVESIATPDILATVPTP